LKYDSGKVNDKGEPIINKIELRFIDSFKFLSSSLKKSKNLEKDQLKELSKHFPKEHLNLITKKLAYPYEYIDSPEKFKKTYLPPIEKFYSSINNEDVKEKEYKNAQEIWNKFEIKDLQEFTNLYNKVDILLLADIMENVREISLKTHKLDPAWYFTTPGFVWDCMLKMMKQKLELLTDYDMILMIENGTRGGISQCSNRHAKANNKYMKEKYDENKESIFLEHLDANNLYGWAMSKYLPYGGFKWNNTEIDVLNAPDNSPKGYIFEVDLSYLEELHDLHSDLPLAPANENLPKHLTTLYDKKKYVVHYTTLKQYVKMGMKLEQIHKVLEFNQSDWLKVYIDFNTVLRTKANNDFKKGFFKLTNNSVFGKTIENLRNRMDIKLCSNERKVEKLIAKTNFESRTIFT
jgi:intergrase/recombinase